MTGGTVETRSPDKVLRIGILLGEGHRLENWQLRLVDHIEMDPRLSLAGLLFHPDPYGNRRDPPLFTLYSSLERRILAREKAYRPRLFNPPQRICKRLIAAEGQDGIDVYTTTAILLELGLDLVIRLTPEGLPEKALDALPFGEWTCSFTEQRSARADWSGYGSIIQKQPSAGLQLQMRGPKGLKTCIAAAAFNIKFSAERNAAFVKERAVTLLRRELGRLADTGEVGQVVAPKTQPAPPPDAVSLARYTGALSMQLLGRAIKAFKAKTRIGSTVWTLYSGKGSIDDFNPTFSQEIPPSKGEIRADPFLLDHEGGTYLFYEAYAPGARKAHIAVGRLEADQLVPMGVALERDYHLSYPFVFHHEGELFMMPETNQARRVEIWRCTEFPQKWELYSTALEGQSPADSVLMKHAGQWWLFTNLSDFHAHEDHCSELHVFQIDGPAFRQVIPHKRNPVVLDGTVARNAGRMFEAQGRLYRPSQRNEYGIYGYGLNIMEIEQLDLDTYRERCVRIIRPDFKPGLIGCHHFDASNDRYIVDARLSY
jgi:hypothetical protein